MPNASISAVGGAMSVPTVILEFTPAMRALVENLVEDLISLLDVVDGPEDVEEPGDDEPSFGASEGLFGWKERLVEPLRFDEAEDDDPAEEDDPKEDGRDAEHDPAEMGLADGGALALCEYEESLSGLGFDRSGHAVARGLLARVRP